MSNNGALRVNLIELLAGHRGKAKAIPGDKMAHILGEKTDRRIRNIIRELIAVGYPVASSVTPPRGYFMVETVTEAKAYQRDLKSRLVEDAYRLRDFKKASGLLLGRVKQGRLI